MSHNVQLNTYKATYPDSTDLSVAANNMADALTALEDGHAGEPSLLQKTFTGMVISVPDPSISITTSVTGSGAEEGGCKATPYTIGSVSNGDKVWFTAIPAAGFTFAGWYVDGEQKSTQESFEETVSYSGANPVTLNYEARFTTV